LDRFGTAEYIARLRRFNASANYLADLKRVVELLQPFTGMKVLDFGCGLGAASSALAALGCVVTGADANGNLLEAAAREHPRVVFKRDDALPREQDAAIALHVLSYVPNVPDTLNRIYGALRAGGRIVFCEPNPLFALAMLPRNLFNDYLADENVVYCRSYSAWPRVLRRAGFTGIQGETYGEFPSFPKNRALRSRVIFTARKVG
jgi:2-polyprenyl-3-methyl-5-hydroxy-6-metoxy-1,4-benzoquinol methylase